MSKKTFDPNKALFPQTSNLDPKFWERVKDLTAYELDNGMRVVIVSDERDRSTFIRMFVNGGAVHQSPELRGVAHFMEHMLFQGTEKFSNSKAIVDFEKDYNLSSNGGTGLDKQDYFVESDNDYESVHAAFTYLEEILFKSTFPESGVEKQKGVVIAEYQTNQSDPDRVAIQELLNHLYGEEHQFAQGGILGTPEEIKSFDRKTLIDFYNTYFSPENMVLVVAGGLPATQYQDLIEQYFADKTSNASWQQNPDLNFQRKRTQNTRELHQDFNHVDVTTGLFFDFKDIELFGEDWAALKVVADVFAVRLFMELREEQGLAYAVSSQFARFDHGMFFLAGGEFPIEKYDNGRKELNKAFNDLKTTPVTEKEFKRAIRHFTSTRWANSARSIANNVGNKLLTFGQLWSPEVFHHLFENLSLSKVNKVVKSRIDTSELETVVMGNLRQK